MEKDPGNGVHQSSNEARRNQCDSFALASTDGGFTSDHLRTVASACWERQMAVDWQQLECSG